MLADNRSSFPSISTSAARCNTAPRAAHLRGVAVRGGPLGYRSEAPDLEREATSTLLDAHEHRVETGSREAERAVRVQHRKRVFVGVVPDDVLVGIEHRH